jgi:poly(A) polymerase
MSPRQEIFLPLEPPVEALVSGLARALALREVPAYLVGGSLRDAILGRPIRDVDLAVEGDSLAIARAVSEELGATYVPLSPERGITRLVFHPQEGETRYVDITPLRGDIVADLTARDFTIDAMAAALSGDGRFELVDPLFGREDLARGIVRAVTPAAFEADGLRLLRGVRIAAELGFHLHGPTSTWMRDRAGYLDGIAPERQREELVRMLATARASWALRTLDDLTLLERILPELAAARGVEQPKEHYWDVFEHSLETVEALDFLLAEHPPKDTRWATFWRELWGPLGWLPGARDHFDEEVSEGHSRLALLKLAALLHDVAKPETKTVDSKGRVRFFGHADAGARVARSIMENLRFSARETRLVSLLVEEHLRPGQLSSEGGPPTRRALFRFFRDTDDAALDVLILSLADHLAARGPRMRVTSWRNHIAYVNQIMARRHLEESLVEPPRLLTGHDIMELLGLQPGPEVGRLLRAIEEAQGSGEIRTRDEALALAQRLARPQRAADRPAAVPDRRARSLAHQRATGTPPGHSRASRERKLRG